MLYRPMKRTQIQRRSVAALVRDALQRSAAGQQRQARRSDFRFVGIGRSRHIEVALAFDPHFVEEGFPPPAERP